MRFLSERKEKSFQILPPHWPTLGKMRGVSSISLLARVRAGWEDVSRLSATPDLGVGNGVLGPAGRWKSVYLVWSLSPALQDPSKMAQDLMAAEHGSHALAVNHPI